MENQSLTIIAFLLLLITSSLYSNTIDTISSNTSSLCQNNGFSIQTRSLGNICFCYGTGFYGQYCEIQCPEIMPTECIVI